MLKLGGSCGIWQTGCGSWGAWGNIPRLLWVMLEFFSFSRDVTRKKNVLAVSETLLSKMKAVVFLNRLCLAYCGPPCKGHHRPSHQGQVRVRDAKVLYLCLELYSL